MQFKELKGLEVKGKDRPRVTGLGLGLAGAAVEIWDKEPEKILRSVRCKEREKVPFMRAHESAKALELKLRLETTSKGVPFVIKQADPERDLDRLVELYEPFAVMKEQMEKRFEIFPDGILGAYVGKDEDKLIASISFLLRNVEIDRSSIWLTEQEDSEEWPLRTWPKFTGNGTFSTHEPYGSEQFCPNVVAHPTDAKGISPAKPLIRTAALWGRNWAKLTGIPIVTNAYSRPSHYKEFVEGVGYVYCDEYLMITLPPEKIPSFDEYVKAQGRAVFRDEYDAAVREMQKAPGSKAYYEYIKEHGPVALSVYMKTTGRKHPDGNVTLHLTNFSWHDDVIPEVIKIIPKGGGGERARDYIDVIRYRPRDWYSYYESPA